MTESQFWKLVKKHLAPEVHATRVENSATDGVSDVTMCRDGVETWVELKVQKGRQLEFRASQPVWIRRRLRARGRVVVLASLGSGVAVYHGGVCMGTAQDPPRPVKGRKAVRVQVAECYAMARFDGVFSWLDVQDVLFGPLEKRTS